MVLPLNCGLLVDGLAFRPLALNVDYNNFDRNRLELNGNYNRDNAARMAPIYTLAYIGFAMKTYIHIYHKLCSYENLQLAFIKARKRKSLKDYVIEFESDLEGNLLKLKQELGNFTYTPSPMITFIVRDPKTRRISASHFRDRVVHHALCNIIAPILEKYFIYDSFANQKHKGTHLAIQRYDKFLGKVATSRDVVESPERERVLISANCLSKSEQLVMH